MSNLLERFHHSMWFYMLASRVRFVPLSVFFPAMVLMLAGMPLRAAALFTRGHRVEPPVSREATKSGLKWILRGSVRPHARASLSRTTHTHSFTLPHASGDHGILIL